MFALSVSGIQRGMIQVKTKSGFSLDLYKDYHALVVGVSEYDKWPDLPNAINDARAVASTLKNLGFSVDLKLDITSAELKTALNRMVFHQGLQKERAILLYFAGHGETLELADGTELGYIVPRDSPLKEKDPADFDEKAISMKEIEAFALKVKSKHVLMVFDSCFSGSLFNLVRGAPVEITEKASMPVRQFITAGGKGEQVPDQSVFKEVFLTGITGDADLNGDAYVTGSELGMHLQTEVVNYTRGGQHPQYGKINNPRLDKGDFVFAFSKKVAGEETEGTTHLDTKSQRLNEEVERLREVRDKLLEKKALLKEKQKLEYELKTMEGQVSKSESSPLESEKPKKESTHLSAIGKSSSNDIALENELKLAIFPFSFTSHSYYVKQVDLVYEVGRVISKSKLFAHFLSSYPLKTSMNVTQIEDEISTEDLWHKGGSSKKPDIAFILKTGKQLGVDAVLTYRLIASTFVDLMEVYLIDINRGKQYRAKEAGFYASALSMEIKSITTKVFSGFEADRQENKR